VSRRGTRILLVIHERGARATSLTRPKHKASTRRKFPSNLAFIQRLFDY
jgi:hypothetical protein